MRKTVYFGQNSWRFWYLRYKDSPYYLLSIISVVIIVCLLLLFRIIIPQVTDWFSVREEVIATQERIGVIKENIQYIKNLDIGRLNSQLQTATVALPPEKDFGAVLDAVSSAALKSGVSLDDFSFQVGNIASGSTHVVDQDQKDLSTIRLMVAITGDVEKLRRFIETLQNTLPVSQVITVEGNGKSATVTVLFYQKQLPLVKVKPEAKIVQVTDANTQLLDMLSSWKTMHVENAIVPESSGKSTIPLF